VTLIEAAAILGVTPDTLRQQIAAGKLRARKIGP
jgi:excisionase family DNA binding protein